jgi:cell division protein FtsB
MQTFPVNMRRVLVIIGIIVLVFLVLEFNRRLEALNKFNEEMGILQADATQVTQTQAALQTAVAYANSTAAVDEWARTDGHYIKDGDLPVVPVAAPGTVPIEMRPPAPTPTPMQKWEVWRILFFGN